MDKKIVILVCFFSLFTLISSLISSAFIFCSEQARTEANSNKVLATNNIYKSTSIIYNQNNKFNLSGLKPGYKTTHSFSITNNNSNTIKYKIEWSNITSTWGEKISGISRPDDFQYTLVCSNGEAVQKTTMPYNEENLLIIDNMELKTNKTNECNLTVEYLDLGIINQSQNNSNSFRGIYKIIVKE